MSAIHPTAIVDPAARIGREVEIDAWSIVGPDVELGNGVKVGSHASIGVFDDSAPQGRVSIGAGSAIRAQVIIVGEVVIGAGVRIGRAAHLIGPLRIGAGTEVFDQAIIGNPGQYPDRHETGGLVEIGNEVVLREQVCVTRPVSTGLTRVGDGSYLMARTQIDHDCHLGKDVKTASGVTFGGYVTVGDCAYLGMNAVVHQRVRIGAHAMVGMNTAVARDIPPYAVFFDRRVQRANAYGMRLHGIVEADIGAIEKAFETLAAGGAIDNLDRSNRWVEDLHVFLRNGDGANLRLFQRTPSLREGALS